MKQLRTCPVCSPMKPLDYYMDNDCEKCDSKGKDRVYVLLKLLKNMGAIPIDIGSAYYDEDKM